MKHWFNLGGGPNPDQLLIQNLHARAARNEARLERLELEVLATAHRVEEDRRRETERQQRASNDV